MQLSSCLSSQVKHVLETQVISNTLVRKVRFSRKTNIRIHPAEKEHLVVAVDRGPRASPQNIKDFAPARKTRATFFSLPRGHLPSSYNGERLKELGFQDLFGCKSLPPVPSSPKPQNKQASTQEPLLPLELEWKAASFGAQPACLPAAAQEAWALCQAWQQRRAADCQDSAGDPAGLMFAITQETPLLPV